MAVGVFKTENCSMSIILETQRLIIKSPALDNFENLYALYSDPEVMQYVGQGVRSREETRKKLAEIIYHFEKHGFSFGDVYKKESGACIGRAGLIYLEMNDSQPEIELGYTLHKAYWNKGYATELAKAFIQWGFEHLPVEKLIAVTHPDNKKSRHVLEKTGMHYVGNVRCYNTEVVKYEIYKK